VRIGELATRTGVPPRMLRYYEEQGLLTAERAENGYRTYREADVGRVRRVRSLIGAGLPSRLARVVLEMEDPDSGWTDRCDRDFAQDLAAELRVIDDRLDSLSRSRDTVAAYLTGVGHPELVPTTPRAVARSAP